MTNEFVLRQRFGERARAVLAELALTTHDLSFRCALPIARIERILDGRQTRLTLRDMGLIASALGTPLYDLMRPIDASARPATEALQVIEQG